MWSNATCPVDQLNELRFLLGRWLALPNLLLSGAALVRPGREPFPRVAPTRLVGRGESIGARQADVGERPVIPRQHFQIPTLGLPSPPTRHQPANRRERVTKAANPKFAI